MKKSFIILTFILFILFVVITLLKYRSPQLSVENDKVKKTLNEKENIQRFWEIYREATEHRIAGRPDKAVVDYERALVLNDHHEDALYYLGNVYLGLDNFNGAKNAWKRLVQINPNSSRAHFRLGDLHLIFDQKELFNIDSAETEFRRALEINKEETAPLLRLGQIALIRNRFSDAKNYFEAVTISNFKNVEAHFLNGYIAWKTGYRQKALKLLVRAAQISPPPQSVNGVLGEGDTIPGNALNRGERSKHQPIFKNYFKDLSGLDSLSLSQQMDNRYQNLDTFLEQIRKISR